MNGRILVIRGGAIGDFILTLPAVGLLRENFPNAHLEIMGYRHIVALAEGRWYANATRSIEYGAMARFFIPGSDLAPDLVEYFTSFHQVISYLYDPDGFFTANLGRAGVKNLLQAWVPIDDSRHAAWQLAQPLEQMALYLEQHAAAVHLTDADHAAAAAVLGSATERPLIAIHAGSGSLKKNWPIERWEELGRRILAHPLEPTLVLAGGEADIQPLAQLSQAWRGLPVVLARDLPLPQLGAIIARTRLFLGHDSGISHLAAAVGARCVLLFGPTDPAVWAPANPRVTVLQAPGGDLRQLMLPVVGAAAWACLAENATVCD